MILRIKDTKNIKEQIQKELGIKLKAEKEDDVVNGYINTKQDGDETIVEVFLYDKDEPANYKEGIYKNIPYSKGHRTHFEVIKEPLGDISKKFK